jgi:hypothetical protein
MLARMFGRGLFFCALFLGCNTAPTASPTPPPKPMTEEASTPPAPPSAPVNVPDAVNRLRDPQPAVRDAAAAEIRRALATNPAAAGDPGEAFWKKKLAAIKPGITAEQFKAATGATEEGGAGSGQTHTMIFRLDDHWVVEIYFDNPDRLREVGPLTSSLRSIWIAPPKDFTGKWTTYFVNGVLSHDIDYSKGTYRRFASYYDNGQLVYEQRYVDGTIDGPEVGYHRDGKKAYEGKYAGGKRIGRWVHWHPNGKMESEETYVDGERDGTSTNWREDGTKSVRFDYKAGKETGQAAWDEKGKLLYAHGTAENEK